MGCEQVAGRGGEVNWYDYLLMAAICAAGTVGFCGIELRLKHLEAQVNLILKHLTGEK